MPNIPDYVFQFHKRGGHEVAYLIINQEAGTTSYYQYMSIDGHWYIMRSVRSGTETAYTYTAPVTTSASTGWTGRAALTYTTPLGAFGEE